MKDEADTLVKHAEREAERSRLQFFATFAELRRRIDPRVIAAEAAENMVGRANHLLDDTKASARNHPGVAAGGAAAFVLAVGLRLWLAKANTRSDAT